MQATSLWSVVWSRRNADIQLPKLIGVMAVFFGLYVLVAELGTFLHFAPLPEYAALWPAAGIALAAVVLYGPRIWPAIALGTVFFGIINGSSLVSVIVITVTSLVQPFAGAYLLRRLQFDPLLSHVSDTIAILVTAGLAGIIGPLINTTLSFANGSVSADQFVLVFAVRWLGTALSMSVLASFIIRWHRRPFPRTASQIGEAFAAFVSLIAVDLVVFLTAYPAHTTLPIVYFILVPLLWISLRIGPRGMTFGLLVTSILALVGVSIHDQLSPMAHILMLVNTETFLIALTVLFLIFVSSEEGRKDAIISLRSYVERLEVALQKIRTEDRTKSEFIAILAHELRNPLAAIRTSVEVIGMEMGEQPSYKPLLSAINERVQTTVRLLDDLLDISRISQHKLELRKEIIDVCDSVRRSIETVEPQIATRGHIIETRLNGPCAAVADPMRLEQIIVNLLTNAIKYTSVGGRITVECYRDGGAIVIEVADTGIGISPHMIERIFEPFVQVSQSTYSNSGLGIGLSLTKQLVEMHGGTIDVYSAGLDQGSTFTVRLLAAPADVQSTLSPAQTMPMPAVASVSPMRPSAEVKNGVSILVVDDNQLAAQGLCKLLTMRGYAAEPAYTGERALMRVKDSRPDVIILDIGLPGMDGYQVARSLREEFNYTGTIIALTGFGQEKDRQKTAEAGFDRHLIKPVGLAEIETVLNEVLHKAA